MMAPRADVPLTDQQQAIVAHDHGPALVFAVAGAGKTTAVVHRIERLVREGVCVPGRILATSFNKQATDELKAALSNWPHCARVQTKTLHAIGFGIINRAQREGLLPFPRLDAGDKDGLEQKILFTTLAEVRRAKVPYTPELEGLDHDDFLSYVGASKGNLRYADLERAGLPPKARRVATQALAPRGLEWYLDLYRNFELVRKRMGAVTYDDMLMSGWELLIRFPDLLAAISAQFEMVLVDEFQDVNLAQFQILHLLTQPHRNYMVIGDDDQTIYEWRGASPRFILEFAATYRAQQYLIDDNFRCQGSQVALANEIIRHNKNRAPKRLSLTQGFGGSTKIVIDADRESMGRTIVETIKAELAAGRRASDMVVLVRIYAQTASIEPWLIEARIPYRVTGSTPFHQRTEVVTLLSYVRLALWERQLTAGATLSDVDAGAWSIAWSRVYNRPKRYFPKDLSEKIRDMVTARNIPLCRALRILTADAPNAALVDRMEALHDTFQWLTSVIETDPADQVLRLLDARLGYREFLKESSGFAETGEARAANVGAVVTYASGKGTPLAFLRHVDEVAVTAATLTRPADALEMTTVFRAKGREWGMVIVPDCNAGFVPFGEPDRLEEERRLFYVAITRAKMHLRLHVVKTAPISRFLEEARAWDTLQAVEMLGAAITVDPGHWTSRQLQTLLTAPHSLGLERFFTAWWRAEPHARVAVSRQMKHVYHVLGQRGAHALVNTKSEHARLWQTLAPADGEQVAEPIPLLETLLAEYVAETERLRAKTVPPPNFVGTPSGFQAGDTVRHATVGLVGVVKKVEFVGGEEEILIEIPGRPPARYVLRYAPFKLVRRGATG
jgi:DNA helicase-2/ATP-dependent DNA helicase PcrA